MNTLYLYGDLYLIRVDDRSYSTVMVQTFGQTNWVSRQEAAVLLRKLRPYGKTLRRIKLEPSL